VNVSGSLYFGKVLLIICMLDLQLYLHNNQSEVVYVGERRVAVRNSTNNGINKKLHVMI
jgi:hypothetical protein